MPLNDAVILEPLDTHRASIIWLHGLGADGNDFAPIVPELDLPEELGVRFIFPHAPLRPVTINGGMMMRAWYDIKDADLSKERERAEFDNSASILTDLINTEVESGISANRIIVAGFSQGGAIALHGGLTYPQRLAGFMILSSYLPFVDVLEMEQALVNNQTSILMMHGEHDPVIPVDFARQSSEILSSKGYPLEWHTYPMQHGVCPQQIQLIGKWLNTRLQN